MATPTVIAAAKRMRIDHLPVHAMMTMVDAHAGAMRMTIGVPGAKTIGQARAGGTTLMTMTARAAAMMMTIAVRAGAMTTTTATPAGAGWMKTTISTTVRAGAGEKATRALLS
jgi:hypothetical protein